MVNSEILRRIARRHMDLRQQAADERRSPNPDIVRLARLLDEQEQVRVKIHMIRQEIGQRNFGR